MTAVVGGITAIAAIAAIAPPVRAPARAAVVTPHVTAGREIRGAVIAARVTDVIAPAIETAGGIEER